MPAMHLCRSCQGKQMKLNECRVTVNVFFFFVNRLVPMLLKRMVYSELDLQTLMSSRDDTSVPDRYELAAGNV